jgi:hypothetical protein
MLFNRTAFFLSDKAMIVKRPKRIFVAEDLKINSYEDIRTYFEQLAKGRNQLERNFHVVVEKIQRIGSSSGRRHGMAIYPHDH